MMPESFHVLWQGLKSDNSAIRARKTGKKKSMEAHIGANVVTYHSWFDMLDKLLLDRGFIKPEPAAVNAGPDNPSRTAQGTLKNSNLQTLRNQCQGQS